MTNHICSMGTTTAKISLGRRRRKKGGGGEFEVVLGPNRETLKVPEGDGFQKVIIGNFSLENSGTYRIIVTGLNLEQNEGELMRLRSLKLKKSK